MFVSKGLTQPEKQNKIEQSVLSDLWFNKWKNLAIAMNFCMVECCTSCKVFGSGLTLSVE